MRFFRSVADAYRLRGSLTAPRTLTRFLARIPSWVGATAMLAVLVIIVRPWGNYPLNDDWNFARAAKLLADKGHIIIDTQSAPSLVGQMLLAWPLIKIFGFSHVVLRMLTVAMAILLIRSIDGLFTTAQVPRRMRLAAFALLIINPLFACLTLSYMTECYGYAVAFLGAAIWFSGRRFESTDNEPVIRMPHAIVGAALIGGSFWIRQFCVLVYPALGLSLLASLTARREWRRLLRSLPSLGLSAVAFLAPIKGYFAWARSTNQLNDAFSGPLAKVFRFELLDWQVNTGLQLVYQAAFLLPMLLIWPLRKRRWFSTAGSCVAMLGFGLVTYSLLQKVAGDDAGPLYLHRMFPFNSNVIHAGGVGPITLTEVFFGLYSWGRSRHFWYVVTVVVVAATGLWGFPARSIGRLWTQSVARIEVGLFGLLLGFFMLAAVVQSSGLENFDRYSLPIFIGCLLFLTVLAASELPDGAPRLWRTVVFAAAAAPLAWFTVAGMHDYFRWNDARWALVDHAVRAGVPTTSIDGGYEVNGWLSLDKVRGPNIDAGCIGPCSCGVASGYIPIWTCHDDSYRIGISVRDGYQEIARFTPHTWFLEPRPLVLSRRWSPGGHR